MKRKQTTAVLIVAVAAAVSLGGCGKVNGEDIVAAYDDMEIKAGVVNLKAQITAASYDTYMASYYGADMWEEEIDTEGGTMADDLRQSTLEETELEYLLEKHMDEYGVTLSDEDEALVDRYTVRFLTDNSDKALDIMGAEGDYVKEMFRLLAIEQRMEDAIKDTADTEVTDEELAAAQEEDETATEESILEQRRSELYTEVTEGWTSEAEWTVDESVLKKISFDKFLKITAEDAGSVEEEEAGTEEISGTEGSFELESVTEIED